LVRSALQSARRHVDVQKVIRGSNSAQSRIVEEHNEEISHEGKISGKEDEGRQKNHDQEEDCQEVFRQKPSRQKGGCETKVTLAAGRHLLSN
jgi:hypothetical protein